MMTNFEDCYLAPYGLGLMKLQFPVNITDPRNLTDLIGHGGEDYGSGGTAGYNFEWEFSFATTTGNSAGMNCSLKDDDFIDNLNNWSGWYC